MEIPSNQLEILSDEILLEICKYLLCGDILRSFFGLNSRMTRMITQYCHHVSLHRISISHSSDLCTNILPQIGFKIQSLVIDCTFALQDAVFIKYFGKKMSITFPSLKKIRLIAFRYGYFIAFLKTLHNLKNLVQINICNLSMLTKNDQKIAFQTLLQANNNQLTSVLIDDDLPEFSYLSFNNVDCCLNILQLRIKMNSIEELPSLFAAVPNVRYLDITFVELDQRGVFFDDINISPLLHLIDFRLHSTKHWWDLNELLVILDQMSNLQRLSLCLFTGDSNLVYGNILLPLLSPTIQEFNYATYYCPVLEFDRNEAIIASWPPSHLITCYVGDTLWFIHTVHWYCSCIEILPSIGNTFSSQILLDTCYDKRVERLEVHSDRSFTLGKSLAVVAKCRRIRELVIIINADGDIFKEDKYSPPSLPQLSRLIQFQLWSSIPVDLNHFSLILISSPNLIRLDLPFDCLIGLLEIEQMSHLLGQRVKTLVILNATESSQVTINERHVHLIASIFRDLRDLHVSLKHLNTSTTIESNEIKPSPMKSMMLYLLSRCKLKANTIIESNEIKPSSMESMILCLLSQFKQHKLNVLTVCIQPSAKIKTDAKEWLKHNSVLGEQLFHADFDEESQHLMIWM